MLRAKMKHALYLTLIFAFALFTARASDSDDEYYPNSESRSDESTSLLNSKTVTVKVQNIQMSVI
jgi:hypothetical protein